MTPTGATLNGIVGAGGLSTTYYFQYGTDTNYGSADAPPRQAVANNSPAARVVAPSPD